jgi:hypothetical protein
MIQKQKRYASELSQPLDSQSVNSFETELDQQKNNQIFAHYMNDINNSILQLKHNIKAHNST